MQQYQCKNCGAILAWSAEDNCLKCDFCGEKYAVTDFEDATNTTDDVKSEALDKEYVLSETTEDMSVYQCKTCGGEVVAMNTTMATTCPYCGEAIAITSKAVGDFRPEQCIPFKKEKKDIVSLFKSYVKKSLLAPKTFKDDHIIEKIQGLYTPFYLHEINDESNHQFRGEKISHSRRGDDRITTHNVFNLKVKAVGNFQKVPTDASKKIDNALMDALEPFDYNDIKDYNPAYMAGFMAEQKDESMNAMNDRAETRCKEAMCKKAQDAFRSKYSSITPITSYNDITSHESSYVMLPVWMLNVKHNGENYQFAINGQTGKVVGKIPIDKAKFARILIACFASVEILASMLIYFM